MLGSELPQAFIYKRRGEGVLYEPFKPDVLGISKAASHWAAAKSRDHGFLSVSSLS